MALLLFSCVRPLTCRTVALQRVVRSSLHVQTLCTDVQSHITSKPVAINRPSAFYLTSYRILSFSELMVSVRSNRSRCFSSQYSDENTSSLNSSSKLHSDDTDSKGIVTKNTTNFSKSDVEQHNSSRNQNKDIQEDETEALSISEEQSQSPYSLNSNIPHSHHGEEMSCTNPPGQTARSDVSFPCDEPSAVTVADSSSMADVHTDGTSSVLMETISVPQPREGEDYRELASPRPMEPSYTLAPYVARSEVLQKLVALGVDLSAVEKVTEAANFLVQSDWMTDIQPRLLFLRDVGVEDAELGRVLTKNPLMLKEDIEEMQDRISYLQSKKFSQEQIAHIVTSAPLTLLLPVTYVDRKLGFLQKTFHLTGDEVRLIATRLPKIIPWKLQKLKDIRFYMKEMLGFSDRELKTMLVAVPRVFISDRHQLGKRFDLLHNVMGLSHQHLTAWPSVFRTRLHIIEQRHRFLLLLGRAQYDPTKENYVSLKALVTGKDKDFCVHVAKTSPSQFYSFLKAL